MVTAEQIEFAVKTASFRFFLRYFLVLWTAETVPFSVKSPTFSFQTVY